MHEHFLLASEVVKNDEIGIFGFKWRGRPLLNVVLEHFYQLVVAKAIKTRLRWREMRLRWMDIKFRIEATIHILFCRSFGEKDGREWRRRNVEVEERPHAYNAWFNVELTWNQAKTLYTSMKNSFALWFMRSWACCVSKHLSYSHYELYSQSAWFQMHPLLNFPLVKLLYTFCCCCCCHWNLCIYIVYFVVIIILKFLSHHLSELFYKIDENCENFPTYFSTLFLSSCWIVGSWIRMIWWINEQKILMWALKCSIDAIFQEVNKCGNYLIGGGKIRTVCEICSLWAIF